MQIDGTDAMAEILVRRGGFSIGYKYIYHSTSNAKEGNQIPQLYLKTITTEQLFHHEDQKSFDYGSQFLLSWPC